MRTALAGLAGLGIALLGAVLLGEQPMEGITVVVGAVLLGMAVGEAIHTVGRHSDDYLAAAAALFTEVGLVLALYIETGHDLRTAPPEAWASLVGGSIVSALWLRSAGRRGASTPAGP